MKYFLYFVIILFVGCSSSDDSDPSPSLIYFPPTSSSVWESVTPASLEWNESALNPLFEFLETNNSRAFIILQNGRIVVEEYWGNNITNTAPFTSATPWYWASAGKSLTATLVGIAQDKELLSIEDRTSDYLGTGWTSLPVEKEHLIQIKHQLTMTTGLDYQVEDVDCTDNGCLQYNADPNQQWYYHNAPYTLLESVVSEAAGTSYNTYTDTQIEQPIGMNGSWVPSGYNNVYWSSARDAARFGLLILNRGTWENTVLVNENYVENMVNSSQAMNLSYGFLWWLNGKGSIIYPGLTAAFPISLAPSAPADLFAAMGKNGQFIDIVPSKGLVVIRMGESPDGSLVPIEMHDQMWALLDDVIK